MLLYVGIGLGILLVILIAVLVLALIMQYRKIANLKKVVQESYSTLKVFLDKRLEIVINLLSMCSENDLKNKEISHLLSIVTGIKQNIESSKRYSFESSLDNSFKTSVATLAKINENNAKFQNLLNNFQSVQADVISSKNYYNNNVEAYNKKLTKTPSAWVANIFGFKKEFYIK